jgi:hypothetical protein
MEHVEGISLPSNLEQLCCTVVCSTTLSTVNWLFSGLEMVYEGGYASYKIANKITNITMWSFTLMADDILSYLPSRLLS